MIVFDLKCGGGHVFEAWFRSSTDFEDQKSRDLLSCPMCNDLNVDKAPMAANVPAKGNQKSQSAPAIAVSTESAVEPTPEKVKAFLSMMATAQSEALKESQWVGRDFDKQARAMDAGELDHSSIHGEVSPEEAKALMEDGINVTPLPFPVIPPEKRN